MMKFLELGNMKEENLKSGINKKVVVVIQKGIKEKQK